MEADLVARATVATTALALQLKLQVEGAVVLHNSNRLALRLLPCDVLARVSVKGREVAALELELAQRLTEALCPVAGLETRVEPRVYERDGLVVTFWNFHESADRAIGPAAYAEALHRLHRGMRSVQTATPHFLDRAATAERLLSHRDRTAALAEDDRLLLIRTLRSARAQIEARGAAEQLLHGEPHPGNVLGTPDGPLFIDLETCCRGPVEFDVAHVPAAVSDHYSDVDGVLLASCRQLVLAMVTAWRWDVHDEFPHGREHGRKLLDLLRAGPPWPVVGALASR